MRLQIIENIEPNLVAAYEEAICSARIQGLTEDVVSIWRHPRSVYITREVSLLYFNKKYADSINLPITRSSVFSGKDTSILVLGGTWSVCIAVGKGIAQDTESFGSMFYYDLWNFVAEKYGLKLERKGNDLVVSNTDRKILGCIYSDATTAYVGNNVFSVKKPEGIDLNEFFRLPDSKFADKETKDADSRISSVFDETGAEIKGEDILSYIKEYLLKMGIKTKDEVGLNSQEMNILNNIKAKHTSDDWIKYAEFER